MFQRILESIYSSSGSGKKEEKEAGSKRIFPNKYSQIKELITKKPWLFIGVSALALLLFSTQVRAALIVLALVAMAILSKLAQVPIPFVVALDLTVFLAVVLTLAYGVFPAIILSLIAYYAGTMLRVQISGRIDDESYFVPPIGLVISAFIASALPFSLLTTAMVATSAYSLFTMAFYWVLRHDIFNEMTFAITVFPFNYWLFANYGQKVLALLVG